MKYIFDFDDVLFNTSTHPNNFRENIYSNLEKVGISPKLAKEYVERERWNKFSLKKMLAHFSTKEDLYEKIMSNNKIFLNQDLIRIIEKLGKNNCYLITYGDEEFQIDKITRTGINDLFAEIIAVPGSKKIAIEKICAQCKDEKVLFVDDKAKHFEDLDFATYTNLKTILFDEKGLEKLKTEIRN